MMNTAKSRLLVTTAALLAGVSFASAQSMSGGASGAASETGTSAGIHSKSGMPLKEDYRLFFLHKQLIGIYNYWEEGEYLPGIPGVKAFEDLAEKIESNFFSMDIARKKNGEWIIIELGDGQVSGLPEQMDKMEFYNRLKDICMSV